MSTDSRRCHEPVRPKESRCDAEVLCPVGEPQGAQIERHERDEETEGGQEEEEAQEPMRRKPVGSQMRRKYEFIECRIFHSVTGVLNVSLEGLRIGRTAPGTVRRP